jgi:hypothetical protein
MGLTAIIPEVEMAPGRRFLVVAVAASLLTSACAPRQVVQQEPPPCTDPLYLRLKATAPDSLSEREWTRLQDLERACVSVRTAAAEHGGESGTMTGMKRNTWWAMTALMAGGAVMWLAMAVWR